MSTPGIDASFQTLGEIVDDLDQGFQGYFFPCLFQGFHIRVRLLARFFFEDRPHGVVERVQIWAIGRPFTSGVSPMRVDCLFSRFVLRLLQTHPASYPIFGLSFLGLWGFA